LVALLSFFFCVFCPLIYCFWLPLSVSSNFSTDYKNWLVNLLILGSCLETWHLRLVSRHKPMSQVLYLWSYINNHKAKKKTTRALPTLIFCAYPKVFLAIFEQALLKSECVPCRN
jgi:hypothetical protein